MVQVPYVPEGLEAIIFTADGDMRQALNNLQVALCFSLAFGSPSTPAWYELHMHSNLPDTRYVMHSALLVSVARYPTWLGGKGV